MTKNDAIELFGTSGKLAHVLGVNPRTLNRWPDRLTDSQRREILGAAIEVKGLVKTQVFFPGCFK